MRAYKRISVAENLNTTQESNNVIVSNKKLKVLGSLFCMLLIFSLLGFSVIDIGIGDEVRRVTAYWSPNLTDIGKLKFVSSDSEFDTMVVSEIEEFVMPFENVLVQETSAGAFDVNGLGSMVVKSCFDGKVEKVELLDGKRNVTIVHKRGIKSVYEGLDNVGVIVGDYVKKNAAIGLSETSQIVFKIYFRNKLITGLTFKDGEMVFL